MSTAKAPKETAEQRALREAEQQRIAVMQQRADADESAAGRRLLTRRTRRVLRMFGARTQMAGAGALGAIAAPSASLGLGGSSASYPLGYGGSGGGGGGFGGGGSQVAFPEL